MSAETILKNTWFGGYKKNDVMQYVDELLDENEKKIKQMEEQINVLMKENKRLKVNTGKDTPIPFPVTSFSNNERVEDLPLTKQMELPEGSYMVAKDNTLVTLPEPEPVYHIKKLENYLASIKDEKDNEPILVPEQNQTTQRQSYTMPQSEPTRRQVEGFDLQQQIAATLEKESLHHSQEAAFMQPISQSMQNEKTMVSQSMAELNYQLSLHEIELLKAELKMTKKMLKLEKKEKKKLKAKLDYSNDLLMQFFQTNQQRVNVRLNRNPNHTHLTGQQGHKQMQGKSFLEKMI